jgi:nucleotide-binding universal stress UspA family protein
MFKTILVPLDGSNLGEAVLAPAMELARLAGGRLILLRVVPPPPPLAMAGPDPITGVGMASALDPAELVEVQREVADEYLNALQARLQSPVPFQIRESFGQPAEQIVAAAHAEGADLIAMSTHGRHGLERFFQGSVADEVLRHADVPLLLVRPAEQN